MSLRAILVFVACIVLPLSAFAASAGACPDSLIPCGCDTGGTPGVVDPAEQCTFDDFIVLAQNVINFLIFKIAAPLAAIMFAYAGYLYLTNRGNEAQVKQAHDVFTYVLIGLIVALAAWLTVNFIVTFFLKPEYNFLAPPSP